MVSVGRFQQITPAPAGVLHADHGAWMARLLDHLAEAGARRPALIATDAGFPSDWAVLIRRTYEGWCRQHGIEPQIGEVATDATPEQVDALVRDLIAARPGTDALVRGPDGTAPRALGTLRSMGRRVGEDLLLAAYADGASLPLCEPRITALDLQPREYGTEAVELLLDLLAGRVAAPVERGHEIDLVVPEHVGLKLLDQVVAAGEVAVPHDPAGQGGEEQHDLVEPGGMRRGPGDVPARVRGQPHLGALCGVRGTVVEYDVDLRVGGGRERAAIAAFSSVESTTAPSGGSR